MIRFSHLFFPAAFATVSLAAAPAPASAQGDLLVAPTRLVMSGGSAQVVLNNIGATPATYRITLELRHMEPDGSLETLPADKISPEQQAVLDMFRYSPRRITLPPNQPQAIRIAVRPPEDLADGEYRVHMSFRALPDVDPAEPAATAAPAPASGFTIKLTPIYGVSIPLIYRKGPLEGGASLANPTIVREGAMSYLKLDMRRTGNRSVYGEIRVIAPGAKDPAFMVRGIAVYSEIPGRTLRLPIPPAQLAGLKGSVQVEYREMPEAGGQLIASVPARF